MTAATIDSDLPAAQQPSWPDRAALDEAVASLATYPPLVFAGEVDSAAAESGLHDEDELTKARSEAELAAVRRASNINR